ncbi:MAG: restriction endonuclease subunit S [bacterium]|nr:restriction endonuclease subunit S [bacterium]
MVRKSGWNTVKLKDICDFIGGGTPSKQVENFWRGNIPWISSSDLMESSIWKINITRHITAEAVAKSATHICPRNTVLVVSRVGVGKVAIAPVEVCTSQDFTSLVSKKHDARFLAYCIQIKMKIMAEKTQGTSIKGVTVENIAQMEIELPPQEEQIAIAEALSDIDSLISSLQKLIEKKKAIKQGAMQELLTGKKRLPGFSGEWKELNFAESAKLKARIGWQGLTTSEYLQSGYAYLVTGTDFHNGRIKWETCHFVDEKRYRQDLNIQIKKHDILLTKDGTIGKVAYISNIQKPTTLNSGVFVIRPAKEDSFDPNFVYHILNSFLFDNFLAKLSAGSTINHLYQKDFVDFTFKAPSELVEQQAIAQVLSDMDSELVQLEKKLAKYQQIKQGMMQELLTGRIRLVDADRKEQPKTQILQERQPAHNQHFDDAVMIAGIVNAFYSEKYPLGRKKVQKLLYLVRRKEQADISAFHKKAAGPYADEVRYKGGEPIAQKNKYIQVKRNEKGSRFEKGVQMQQALTYLQDWGKQGDVDWLVSQFQYTSVNELELLATVDMAICDLRREGKEISAASIKDLIRSNKEWRDKLKKAYFKDADIQRAIKKCEDLFES